jgi:hypothetical protein
MDHFKIIDHLYKKSESIRRMDDFRSHPFFTIETGQTGAVRPRTDANTEHYLEARITTTFWANQAQFEHARELAEQALVYRLYGEVIAELSELRLQISNGNREACLMAVDRLGSKLYLNR